MTFSSDMTMNQMMGTDAVKFKNTLPNDLRQEYEIRLLECFTEPDPAACAEKLMHEFQKRIAPTEKKECELLYIAMIQSFMHFINVFATNSGLENGTIKHDNQKRYIYVVLPKFFNVLSFNNYK
ncbi:uncharacterized protein TNCT_296871 [Trichonephila clavata]|uniref:Uncharacterized protein n=1 Tax=Trichonephila clavata TaxID=2740835 RepID=A0A8X6KLK2_TRICU|nr:uncharacterized protein TNCT_296871 [Trichonephila clavata]